MEFENKITDCAFNINPIQGFCSDEATV